MTFYPDWFIPEWVKPTNNSVVSCAWCEGYEGHESYCGRAAFVAEYQRLVRIAEAAHDFVSENDLQPSADLDALVAALHAGVPA